jgi:hypothetical protein
MVTRLGNRSYKRTRVTSGKECGALQDLAVLTPSLIVCAVFLLGVFALLRHEMAPKRRNREDGGAAEDMSASRRISGQEETGPTAASDAEEEVHRQAGRRSPG